MSALDLLKAVESVATLIALGIGGTWAYVKLVKRREHAPRIEFTVDIAFIGSQGGYWLVELLALVENKGLVRHLIREFAFDLRALRIDDPVREGSAEINGQTEIPHLVKRGAWIPKGWESTFIEPGLRTRYSYVAALPKTASFALLHGRFDYHGETVFHTADRLVRVPTEGPAPPATAACGSTAVPPRP